MKKSKDCIAFLLEAGADTSLKDPCNNTAVKIAEKQGMQDVVHLLQGVNLGV